MKKLFLIAIILTVVFLSCKKEKGETNEKDCPVVAASLVPKVVKDSFMHRYPTDSVRIWFNKDSVAFCAFFVSSGIEKLAQFSNSGNFIKEEIETNENNEHEDSTVAEKPNTGCKCEVHGQND
ncbi:MAG: hypothetical protein ABIP35_00105 [Ginsengibacter sp.]